jgi:hypothetical protein
MYPIQSPRRQNSEFLGVTIASSYTYPTNYYFIIVQIPILRRVMTPAGSLPFI